MTRQKLLRSITTSTAPRRPILLLVLLWMVPTYISHRVFINQFIFHELHFRQSFGQYHLLLLPDAFDGKDMTVDSENEISLHSSTWFLVIPTFLSFDEF